MVAIIDVIFLQMPDSSKIHYSSIILFQIEKSFLQTSLGPFQTSMMQN